MQGIPIRAQKCEDYKWVEPFLDKVSPSSVTNDNRYIFQELIKDNTNDISDYLITMNESLLKNNQFSAWAKHYPMTFHLSQNALSFPLELFNDVCHETTVSSYTSRLTLFFCQEEYGSTEHFVSNI
ncbi:hypothetical protein JTB14_037124 [Gonioctena quinquepunctata]|nr:hypothetical protein JTB14_037124 [Gonioctena quinquepunctata]